MPLLPSEQIEQARSVDLLTYLQTHEPYSIQKSGTSEYCLVEHDSFKMSNGRWYWFSRGFGGYNALDFLIKVRGLDFPDAVNHLTNGIAVNYTQKPPPKIEQKKPPKVFRLPAANVNNDKVIAYLRGRGIDNDIIKRCIADGLLYETAKSHNCVFAGFDGDKARFACERGISDDYKKDVYGSDKQFSFVLPPINPTSTNLAVMESPIDSLSHASIHKMGSNKWDGYRLSLGGVSSVALISFLERHPEITTIQLCLDNDKAGLTATNRIIGELLSDKQKPEETGATNGSVFSHSGKIMRFSNIKLSVVPAPIGKDYSDTLNAILQLNKDKSNENRPHKAVFAI